MPNGRRVAGGILLLLVAILAMHGVMGPWVGSFAAGLEIAAIVWLLMRKVTVSCRVTISVLALAATIYGIQHEGWPIVSVQKILGGILHTLAYSGLLVWFLRSLRPGREPVVTGFARQLRTTMPSDVASYTRCVTIAWCVFFAAQLITSAGLLIVAPVTLWSDFVTLLNLPLIAVMTLAEFAVRMVLFRREVRTGLLATLAGLRQIRGLPGR